MVTLLCILAFFAFMFLTFNYLVVLKGGYYILAFIFNPVTIIIGSFLMVAMK